MRSDFLIRAIALIFLIGCVTVYNPATGRKEWYLFDDATEISWGKAMAQEFLKKHNLIKDEKLISYVQEMGEKIAQESHRRHLQYHFYLIDENRLNAFAMPGGHIFIYQGLLGKVTKDELAFVLAHEIGHVCARHSLKRLGASLGFTVLTTILLRKPTQASARNLANQLFNLISLGYSRSDEFQADSLGLEYSLKAGYDPKAAFSLFEKLKEEAKGNFQLPVYLQSHPYPEERIKNIKKRLKELKTGGGQ